jgi:hypothetical protein
VTIADQQANEVLVSLHLAALVVRYPESLDGAAAEKLVERLLRDLTECRQRLRTEFPAAERTLEPMVRDIEGLRAAAEAGEILNRMWPERVKEIGKRLTEVADQVYEVIDSRGLAVDAGIEFALIGALPGIKRSRVEIEKRFYEQSRQKVFHWHFGAASKRLESGSQLPDSVEGATDFWWDRHWTTGDPNDPGRDDYEITVCVLGAGDNVIWRELADDSFESRVHAALEQRLGSRFGKLDRGRYAGPRRDGFPFG